MAESVSSYARASVHLDFEHDNSPSLYCPVTRQLLLPGFVYFGSTAPWDEIDYDGIETVMFVFVAGAPLYLSGLVEESIDARRVELRTELARAEQTLPHEGSSDLEIVARNLDLGPAALVLCVTWNGREDTGVVIGLDLAAPLASEGQ
jgi:hypothetical protein